MKITQTAELLCNMLYKHPAFQAQGSGRTTAFDVFCRPLVIAGLSFLSALKEYRALDGKADTRFLAAAVAEVYAAAVRQSLPPERDVLRDQRLDELALHILGTARRA